MKRFRLMKQAMRNRKARLRRDGIRLTLATAVVGVALFGLYVAIAGKSQDIEKREAARLAEIERLQAAKIQALRTGTILFVTFTKYCEEHRFDNSTGYTVGIDYVDCDERLARDKITKKEVATGTDMKDMLASFKK